MSLKNEIMALADALVVASLAKSVAYGSSEQLLSRCSAAVARANAALEAKAAVADELLAALLKIGGLDPAVDSDEGHNEWGEADCFRQAQSIANAAINSATGGVK